MPSTQPILDILIGSGWGIVMAFLLIGWGNIALLTHKNKQPLWVSGSIGIAIFILLATTLDALEVATRTNLLILLMVGFLGLLPLIKSSKEIGDLPLGKLIGSTFLIIISLVFLGISANSWVYGGNWDDTSGYWPICQQMASKGFSEGSLAFRRSLSLGGQYGLQTLGMLFTNEMGGSIYDRGVGAILCAALGLGIFLKYKGNKLIGFFLGIAATLVPQYALNSAPAVLITLLLLASWRMKEAPIFLGLLLGAALTLRTQAIIPGLLIIGATAILSLRNIGIKKATINQIFTLIIIALTIAPSVITYYKQFETPFIYIHPGTVNPIYISFQTEGSNLLSKLQELLTTSLLIIGVTVFCVMAGVGRGMSAIALMTLAMTFYSMPEYSGNEWSRYTWPVFSAAFLSALQEATNKKRWVGYILMALSIPLLKGPMDMVRFNIENSTTAYTKHIKREYLWEIGLLSQLSIPEGAGVIVISRTPTTLDFSRNNLIIWDSFPAVGKSPETSNPKDWQDWTRKQEADYIMYENWDLPGLYDEVLKRNLTIEEIWTSHMSENLDHYNRVWKPDRLQKINLLKELRKSVPSWEEAGSVILDLRQEKEGDNKLVP